MADITNIGFRVDTSQIEKGYKRLGKMGEQAEKSERKIDKMAKGAKAAGTAISGMATAASASVVAITALMNHLANVERELQASARMAGLTTDQFEAMGFAYRQFGLTVEQVNDIYKDSRERVGEWLNSQSGALQDFGDAMGMSKDEITAFAKEVDGLNGQELLQRMVNDLEEAGVSGNQLSGVMEAMASEATRMIPALENNGDAINSLANEYVKFNSAFSLNDDDVQNYANLAKNFDLFVDTAQNGITKTLSPLAEVMSVLAIEATEFLSALSSGSIAAAQDQYSEALEEQLEARRLLGEAQNIPLAFGQDVIDQETKIAQARLDAANKAVESADKQLEAAKKTAQAQLEINRVTTRNINVNVTGGLTGTETKKQTEEINKQADAYARWIAQIENAVDPTKALKEEIDDLWMAMFSDDIDWEVGEKAIENIQKKLDDLTAKDTAKDFNDLFNEVGDGAVSALSSIQDLSAQGSDEYKRLGMAIQAVNTIMAVQSALVSASTGNIIGVVSAAAGFLGSLGGDDFENISVDIQANQNLNIWGEKADSIDKSMSITAGATKDLVGINTKMLDAMTTLNNSMLAAAGIVSRDVEFGSIDMSGSITENPFAPITGLFNDLTFGLFDALTFGIFDFLGGFLGGSSEVVDQGIQIIGGSLGELMENVTVEAFQTVSYKKWKLGSTKQKHNFTDISDQVGEQVSLVFGSIADAVFAGGEILGFSEDYLTTAIQNFQVGFEKISLMGLSAEEQQAEINAYFSQVFDDLAEGVIEFLPDLQQAGEGLGETLSRVAAQVSIADVMVERFGVMFGDKMADPEAFAKASDNIATLVGGVENFAELTSKFTDAFATDQQKFDIYQDALVDQLTEVGLSLPDSTSGFYDLMNGIDATTEAGQQQIATLLGLTDTASQYYELLKKKEEERASLESQFAQMIGDTDYLREQELAALDESNRALQEKIWAYEDEQKALEKINAIQAEQESLLARLANTLGDTTYAREKELEGIDESNKGLLEYIYALEDANKAFDEARTVLDSALSGLSQSIEAEKESINSTYQEMIDAIESQSEEARNKVSGLEDLISSLSSAFDSVSDSISGVTLSSRQNAQKMLDTQLEIAKSSGQAPDSSMIEGALSTISKPSEDLYSDFTSFARDQAIAANTINDLLGVTDDQLTDAEKQLEALDSQLAVSEEWYEAEIERLDKLYASYEKQYNAIIGVDDSVLSVKDATLDLKKAMEDYAKAEADRQDLINQSQEGGSVYNAIVEMNKELASMQEAQLDLLASIESNIKRMRLIDEGLTVA